MTKDPIALGLKKLIDSKGLKYRVVAERSGYTAQAFSDMLHDRRTIKAVDLARIAQAIDSTPQDIYDYSAEFYERQRRVTT